MCRICPYTMTRGFTLSTCVPPELELQGWITETDMKIMFSEITSIFYCTHIIVSKLSSIFTKLHKYNTKIFLPFKALSLRYALPDLILLNCILPSDCIHMYRALLNISLS